MKKIVVWIKRQEEIVKKLNANNRSHSRHLDCDTCLKLGLKILPLESSQEFQEDVLSVHHSYIITIDNSTISKIIENQYGIRYITFQN